MRFGERLMQQADDLARFSHNEHGLTRTYLTAEHRQAGDYIKALMIEAGMEADYDSMGDLIGRYVGFRPDLPVILTGSHMDSVVNAGKYDGLFGILTAIACVRDMHERGVRLQQSIEVIAFGDEEGVRFGVTMIGSSAMTGRFDAAWLEKRDAEQISMRDALSSFGTDPEAWVQLKRDFANVACFVESHIEQGPVLLDADLPVGIVTAIAGCSRVKVNVVGLAGHAGTVPMHKRRDALAAAAEMALACEHLGRERADRLVCTVGTFQVAGGGAINVIPGDVGFSIDLRSDSDADRLTARSDLREACAGIAARRMVKMDWDNFFELSAAPCFPALQKQLDEAIVAHGLSAYYLPSGAGHDAMEFALKVPTAMLFVRCGNGGISHNPLEIMTAEDAETATSVLLYFFEHFRPVV